MWKYSYWKWIWFILITQRQLEYEENLIHLLFEKQDTIFMDTNRNKDNGSWEKTYKNFKSGIAFSPSLTTSLKLQYETKHGFVFASLFGWFYLTMFSCSHWCLKSYNTPLLLRSNTRTGYQSLWSILCAFFLIIHFDSIKNFKAKFRVKSTAWIIEQVPSNCRITEYYRNKQTVVSSLM